MDPITLITGCVGTAVTIQKLLLSIASFISDVRSARGDLDTVSRELHSLKSILDLLKDDLDSNSGVKLPDTLVRQVKGIVTNCNGVVENIARVLQKHEGNKSYKAAQWALWGRSDVEKLQTTLEAHKSALDIALDMIQLYDN
jgi:Fungal N-terminal domain of STAND proteins